jgi:uncharacterized protein UPF0158
MKRKPLHIDWDELEAAFENRSEDLVYYLDLVSGQIVLEGEGEDAHFDDDDEMKDAVEDNGGNRPEVTRLYVVSFTNDDELDWMDDFIDGDAKIQGDLKDKLVECVTQGSPQAFKDGLRNHAEVRDRWFLFRSERLHDVMDAWLDEHKVNPASPPPWK